MAKDDKSLGAALGLTTNGGVNKRPQTAANAMQMAGVTSDNPYSGMTTATNYGTKRQTSTPNSLPTQQDQGTQSAQGQQANMPWWERIGANVQPGEPLTDDWAKTYASQLTRMKTGEQDKLQQQQDAQSKAEQEAAEAQAKAEQEAAEAQAKAEQEAAEAEEEAERDAKERLAAEHQGLISGDNVLAVQNQLARQLENYDFLTQMNRALADQQLRQNSAKTSSDRFEAQRDLLGAATGLFGSMGNAMNSSTLGNLMTMLEQRNDKENNTYWTQHQANQNAIENAYLDSLNQNEYARRDAMQSAEKAIRDIESDWAANLNNINPDLFQQGAVNGIGHLSSTTAWADNPQLHMSQAKPLKREFYGGINQDSGYYATPVSQATTNTHDYYGSRYSNGQDYFANMMNRFSGR